MCLGLGMSPTHGGARTSACQVSTGGPDRGSCGQEEGSETPGGASAQGRALAHPPRVDGGE